MASDGVEIYYEIDHHHKSLHTLILVHGLGGDSTAWDEEREYLHNLGYSLVTVDLRGHGKSNRPDKVESYDLIRIAQDIKELIEYEEISNPVLIGHCFGGMIGILLQSHYPHILKKLILVDTSYKAPALSKLINNNRIIEKIFYLIVDNLPELGYKRQDIKVYKGTSDWNIKRIFSDIMHTSLKSYFKIMYQMLSYNAEDMLEKIEIPTLIICGEKDSVFPPEISAKIAFKIPHAEYKIIPEANHIVVLNHPVELAQIIDDYLSKRPKENVLIPYILRSNDLA